MFSRHDSWIKDAVSCQVIRSYCYAMPWFIRTLLLCTHRNTRCTLWNRSSMLVFRCLRQENPSITSKLKTLHARLNENCTKNWQFSFCNCELLLSLGGLKITFVLSNLCSKLDSHFVHGLWRGVIMTHRWHRNLCPKPLRLAMCTGSASVINGCSWLVVGVFGNTEPTENYVVRNYAYR